MLLNVHFKLLEEGMDDPPGETPATGVALAGGKRPGAAVPAAGTAPAAVGSTPSASGATYFWKRMAMGLVPLTTGAGCECVCVSVCVCVRVCVCTHDCSLCALVCVHARLVVAGVCLYV